MIVSLYHDVGKVGRPGQPLYINNPYFPSSPYSTPYAVDPALLYMDVPTYSLYLVNSNIRNRTTHPVLKDPRQVCFS